MPPVVKKERDPGRVRLWLWYPAAPSRARLPVLLYVHGLRGETGSNAALLHALAARGFVVIEVSQDCDGRGALDFTSGLASIRSRRYADRQVGLLARTLTAVLDQLGAVGPDLLPAPLLAALDTSCAGLLGFSFGGAVAAEASRLDPRFRAVLNLDGWLFGAAASEGFPAAYMLITDTLDAPLACELEARSRYRRFVALQHSRDIGFQTRRLASGGGYVLEIPGVEHASFGGAPPPARPRSGLETPQGEPLSETVARYAIAFFERHLLDVEASIVDRSHAPPPGIRFTVWPMVEARRAGSRSLI